MSSLFVQGHDISLGLFSLVKGKLFASQFFVGRITHLDVMIRFQHTFGHIAYFSVQSGMIAQWVVMARHRSSLPGSTLNSGYCLQNFASSLMSVWVFFKFSSILPPNMLTHVKHNRQTNYTSSSRSTLIDFVGLVRCESVCLDLHVYVFLGGL